MVRSDSRRTFWTVYLPFFLYLALLFTLSSLPTLPAPDYGIALSDKVNHFLAYALLGVLGMRAIEHRAVTRGIRSHVVMALLFCALYGVVDEIHQMAVPGRTAEVADWIADVLGGLVGIGVMAFVRGWARKRHS